MRGRSVVCAIGLAGIGAVLAGGTVLGGEAESDAARVPVPPRVVAASDVEAGRYLVAVAGCNDCHTPGYMEKNGDVPEDLWLTGSPVGWQGPWGTTYPANLRRFADALDADTFVEATRLRNSMPPMPWASLHHMSEQDLRAVFAYIKSLPVTGDFMPTYVPPGEPVKTPYLSMVPVMPKSGASK